MDSRIAIMAALILAGCFELILRLVLVIAIMATFIGAIMIVVNAIEDPDSTRRLLSSTCFRQVGQIMAEYQRDTSRSTLSRRQQRKLDFTRAINELELAKLREQEARLRSIRELEDGISYPLQRTDLGKKS